MKDNIRKLAQEAGFAFWKNESWKPHGAVIDWSSQYDKEFECFVDLLIKDVINCIESDARSIARKSQYIESGVLLSEVEKLKEWYGLCT